MENKMYCVEIVHTDHDQDNVPFYFITQEEAFNFVTTVINNGYRALVGLEDEND